MNELLNFQLKKVWLGGILGFPRPFPPSLYKPFFKLTTYNIQVAKTGGYPLFNIV